MTDEELEAIKAERERLAAAYITDGRPATSARGIHHAALICFSATCPSTLPSLFPTAVRGAGLSVSFNVAISLFAGTTSVVVGALVGATGDLDWPAYYLIAAGVVGVVSLLFLHEPNGRRMWGSAPAAASEEEARELVGSGASDAA